MKKTVFVLMVLAMTVPLFANGQAEGVQKEKKVISVFITKPVWADTMPAVIEAFNAQYPDIQVEPEIVGGGTDWRPVLSTKSRTGNLPDIFMIEGAADYTLWKEFLDDLSDMDAVKHFLPIARSTAYVDGQLMGLPLGVEGYGYIYNKKLFREAGISKVPETFTELKEATAKLKAKGITPFVSGYGTWWVISNHQFNIPFAMQDDPAAFIAGLNQGTERMVGNKQFMNLERIIDLVSRNTANPPLTEDHNMQVSLFAGEKAAMIQQGNWKEKAILDTNPGIEMGLLPIATGDDPATSGRIPVGVPWYFVVKKDSDVNAEARTFLNWLLNEKGGQEQLVTNLNTIPAYDNFSIDPKGGISKDILTYSKAGKTIPWTFGLWPQGYVKNAADIFQAYVAGKMTYEEALIKLEKDWQSLLK